MITTSSIKKIRSLVLKAKKNRKKIGFVPTMGALHKGHLSLVKSARKQCNYVVVSIFVNPTQFGKNEDFSKYPRSLKKDEALLKKEKVDTVFYPKVVDMYPKNFSTYVNEVSLSKGLCGKSRPGHFRGVTTVVNKLFNIVNPDIAYFGQKDYQQAQVIKRMADDLNIPIDIKVLPIVRESDGLAMSSRNQYLNETQRKKSLSLYKGLREVRQAIKKGQRDVAQLVKILKSTFRKNGITKIDYVKIVDAVSLEELKKIKGKVVVMIAAFVGKTRLIDNEVINVKK